ncbi:MAG: SPFH domain-containing protein [Deltaproteobacteria bacterium]|nr:SPFH domain-containing protein [Deltaproteobacteria bacterium]
MATISRFGFLRHLRADPNTFIMHYAKGKLRRQGRGLAYFFDPLVAGIAEIPLQENDVIFAITEPTKDFQLATVQGVITYRFSEPAAAADAINFTIDPNTGAYVQPPIEKVQSFLSRLATGATRKYLGTATIEEAVTVGADPIRDAIVAVLDTDPGIKKMGMTIGTVRVLSVRATAELEKALQTPTRELIQQRADEATFSRRAVAVEKERAIKENELHTQIELAKRNEVLITQQGQNQALAAKTAAQAARITAEAEAERNLLTARTAAENDKVRAKGQAESMRTVGETQGALEKERAKLYGDSPRHVLSGLALMELAHKLQTIGHLNVTPDLAAELFGDLLRKQS